MVRVHPIQDISDVHSSLLEVRVVGLHYRINNMMIHYVEKHPCFYHHVCQCGMAKDAALGVRVMTLS